MSAAQYYQYPKLTPWQRAALDAEQFHHFVPPLRYFTTIQAAFILGLSGTAIRELATQGRLSYRSTQITGTKPTFSFDRLGLLYYLASVSELAPADFNALIVKFLCSLTSAPLLRAILSTVKAELARIAKPFVWEDFTRYAHWQPTAAAARILGVLPYKLAHLAEAGRVETMRKEITGTRGDRVFSTRSLVLFCASMPGLKAAEAKDCAVQFVKSIESAHVLRVILPVTETQIAKLAGGSRK